MATRTKKAAAKSAMRIDVGDLLAHLSESLRESGDVFPEVEATSIATLRVLTKTGKQFTITVEEK